ncbi:hypothetical protein [Thermosulfuriphilus sp.]
MAERLDPNMKIEVPPEQIIYAKILKYGSFVGIALMLITFIIYIAGFLPPYVPIDKLPQYWNMSAYEFLEKANMPSGWGWINLLNHGDILNFLGIAFLAGLTIICYLAIVPFLFSSGARAVGIIAIVEVLILSLAASGIIHVGH